MKGNGRVRRGESRAGVRVWNMGKEKELSWRVKGITRGGKDKSLAEMWRH